MNEKPPSLEVLEKAKETENFCRDLKFSPAFHWFLKQLYSKRDSIVEDLTTLRSVDETRMQQGNLAVFNNIVKNRHGELVCPLLEGLAQQAKRILPVE